jgi:hypothetical protein
VPSKKNQKKEKEEERKQQKRKVPLTSFTVCNSTREARSKACKLKKNTTEKKK